MTEEQIAPTEHRSPPRRGGFLWGLALGLVLATALVAANDMTIRVLPVPGTARAEVPEPEPAAATVATWIAGGLPAGFTVRVDGRPSPIESGDGGAVLTRPADARTLSIAGPRGVLWATRFTGGGEADTVHPVLGGEIVIEVDPQGPVGDLYVNGEPAGRAPGAVDRVPPGWNLVSIRDGGRTLFEEDVEVRPDEVAMVEVPPAPPRGHGELLVRAFMLTEEGPVASADNAVRIDGSDAGRTPLTVTLPAGLHSVSVERPGFARIVDVVNLPAGQMRQVRADFGREDILDVRLVPPPQFDAGHPGALVVEISAGGESVVLERGTLHLLQPGREETVDLPLVSDPASRRLWLAAIPAELLRAGSELTVYARAVDELGRTGISEMGTIVVR